MSSAAERGGETARPDAAGAWRALARQIAAPELPERTRVLLGDAMPRSGGLEAAVLRDAAARLDRLARALAAGETAREPYREAALALSGLGPGLTPTGDDLLIGAMAAATRLASVGIIEEAARDAYREALETLDGERTTLVAREMVRYAARGHFPEALARFVDALGGPRPYDVAAEAARLADVGAHSGADMLAGAMAVARAVVHAAGEGARPCEAASAGEEAHARKAGAAGGGARACEAGSPGALSRAEGAA